METHGLNHSTSRVANHVAHLALGSLQGLVGAAVCIPTGLVTAAFLARQLGPEDYGLLTVAATIVGLIEISITLGFCRSAEKFVSQAEDWRSVASKFLQAQLLIAVIVSLSLFAAAPALSLMLNSPEMSFFLRVYSFIFPISSMIEIHKSILIGRGYFGRRAVLMGAYWVFRLFAVILFVSIHPSVTSVIMANIGASCMTFLWARFHTNPAIFRSSDFPVQNLWDYAWPLFLYTVSINVFRQLDLLFVKAMCETPSVTGFYSATKNLTLIPALVSIALSPLLIAKLSQLMKLGHQKDAYIIARLSMRLILCTLPFVGLAAGSAAQLVEAIYGVHFMPAAPLFAVLIFGASGMSMISITVSILIVADKPRLPIGLMGPLVPIASLAHYLVIPRFGAIGAALMTTALSWVAALVAILAVGRIWGVFPSLGTFLRSIMISGLTYAFALLWPAPGCLLILKLILIGIFITVAFLLSGEFSHRELNLIRSMLPGQLERS
ncbi:MAG: oligosaccharide flippase family protein [Deltaproteobacteria bacterium]|nr:oligosaccharide flippase family protein [Deltaproteobacteria bacterium]